jgi:hypothetical protein
VRINSTYHAWRLVIEELSIWWEQVAVREGEGGANGR